MERSIEYKLRNKMPGAAIRDVNHIHRCSCAHGPLEVENKRMPNQEVGKRFGYDLEISVVVVVSGDG
ncbi:hypothetical protein EVAR_97761_1 [Eumeta japonica]|uniref:Uncharacterized protein n=1 Tax=Eumeta variegata TaxID=151549 RepID=A0A4C1XA96_EUMVA|nr:hypothetical protein EVAR_97761_1 [Eumeta japonica]